MAYLLNNVDLSTYGILPGQIQGGNIAMSGCFDFPARVGTVMHQWGDENGVEPYVSPGELFFGGRDLSFRGLIQGTRSQIHDNLTSLYTQINSQASGTVVFSTPYGDYGVYVKDVMPSHNRTISEFTINMREPVVAITGGSIPTGASGVDTYYIDLVPMNAYGLYFSGSKDANNLPQMQPQSFTKIEAEGYQVAKRGPSRFDFNGFIAGDSIAGFNSSIKNLYALYAFPSVKVFNINGDISFTCLLKDGFKISNVWYYGGKMIGKFSSQLTVISTA